MKQRLLLAFLALLLLTGCTPIFEDAASPSLSTPAVGDAEHRPDPTEAPIAIEVSPTAAPAATAKPTAKPTTKPTATPQPTVAPTPTAAPTPAVSPSPTPAELPIALHREGPLETLRTMGQTPIAFDPAALARTLDCEPGVVAGVDGRVLANALSNANLPVNFIPTGEEGYRVDVTYHTVESLPIGGRNHEAALFFFDYGQGWDITILLFLKAEEGWLLSDALATSGMHGFDPDLPSYASTAAHNPHGLALGDHTFLVYSTLMKNAWLVVRDCAHGTGLLSVQERWYNLHTAETEISAVLQYQESTLPSEAEFAHGVVKSYDLSMMEIYEEISHVTGDPSDGAKEDRFGVVSRRYTFNPATFRMELDWERYDEGVTMAYAQAVIRYDRAE